MLSVQHISIVVAMMIGTMATRFLPFVLFPTTKEPPKWVRYLGVVLPYAVMGLLIVYCLKDAFSTQFHGAFELLSILLIVALHKWKHNTFLSIAGGTIFYMLLVQNLM